MKPLYKNYHEGYWFSKNGHKAYMRGEKPLFLWTADKDDLEETVAHHIEEHPVDGPRSVRMVTRSLVMFYRLR